MARLISEVLCGELIFFTNALFLFRREIVIHLEELPDFFNALALDQRGNLRRAQLQKRLDIKVVRSQHNVKQQGLVDVLSDILGVSWVDVLTEIVGGEGLLDFRLGADRLLQLDELHALSHDAGADLGDGKWLVIFSAAVVDKTLDQCGVLGVRLVHSDDLVFAALKFHSLSVVICRFNHLILVFALLRMSQINKKLIIKI